MKILTISRFDCLFKKIFTGRNIVPVFFSLALFFPLSLYSDLRTIKSNRLVVGRIWKVYSGQNRVWAKLNKDFDKWRNKKIYIENNSSRIIAEFQRSKGFLKFNNLSKNKKDILFSGTVRPLQNSRLYFQSHKSRVEIPVRMGYLLVIKYEKPQWLEQPKRSENPFVVQKSVKSYAKRVILAKDQREMVLITRGKFLMGSNEGSPNEHPQRIVYLDDFYIDKYEVSNQDYYKYRRKSKPNKDEMDLPFTKASYYNAMNYCRWVGKDLPTEEQWEKAARGTGLSKVRDHLGMLRYLNEPISFPWGNKFDRSKCNGAGRLEYLLPVNSLPEGQSSYGVFHAAGNVMEWTKSWYKAYPKSYAHSRDFGEIFKVLRGGDFSSSKWDLRVSRRLAGGIPSLAGDKRGGIRCVYNIKASTEGGP